MNRTSSNVTLSLIVPAYNEQDAIESVVGEWIAELDRLGIAFEARVYDDGSQDATRETLERMAGDEERLVVCSHANRGHGPTLLRGYREARGDWVLQVDGDGEIGPEAFATLWKHREDHDVLLGYRTGRAAGLGRRWISYCARASVRAFYGAAVRDANTPYRLMRADRLKEILPLIPADAFAPNVILVGIAKRRQMRIAEFPAPHRPRLGGTPSLARGRLWRAAARSWIETAVAARAVARDEVRRR